MGIKGIRRVTIAILAGLVALLPAALPTTVHAQPPSSSQPSTLVQEVTNASPAPGGSVFLDSVEGFEPTGGVAVFEPDTESSEVFVFGGVDSAASALTGVVRFDSNSYEVGTTVSSCNFTDISVEVIVALVNCLLEPVVDPGTEDLVRQLWENTAIPPHPTATIGPIIMKAEPLPESLSDGETGGLLEDLTDLSHRSCGVRGNAEGNYEKARFENDMHQWGRLTIWGDRPCPNKIKTIGGAVRIIDHGLLFASPEVSPLGTTSGGPFGPHTATTEQWVAGLDALPPTNYHAFGSRIEWRYKLWMYTRAGWVFPGGVRKISGCWKREAINPGDPGPPERIRCEP